MAGFTFLSTWPLSRVTVCFVSEIGFSPRGLKYDGWPSLLFTVFRYQIPPRLKGFDNGALGFI